METSFTLLYLWKHLYVSKNSIIYRNIFFYRLIMNVLYKGNYFKRFEPVYKLISGKNVVELCFGDTCIAYYCKQNNINWTGFDINQIFVKNAQKKGFNAEIADIQRVENFPTADTLVISGSLYHFQSDLENLFIKALSCSAYIIISEPVINLSNRKGFIGKLAQGSATVEKQKQQFRFNELTLLETLNSLSKKLYFNYKVVERFDKDLIIVITK